MRPCGCLGAPNDGSHAYFQLATTTTDANGLWSAKVPAGPSRIIAGVFDGSATLQPSIGKATDDRAGGGEADQGHARVGSPGAARSRSSASSVAGICRAAGALVRLRIGYGKAFVTYGVKEHVRGDGRFTTTYRFGAGVSSIHRRYRFQIASLPTGDYPYAPARSRAISVLVGGHPTVRHRGARHLQGGQLAMIARSRGEHDNHWDRPRSLGKWGAGYRWLRVAPGATTFASGRRVAPVEGPIWSNGGGDSRRVGVGRLGAGPLVGDRSPAGLPATPRAWLDAYEAAAVDNPGRVCSVLFAPQLAHAYARSVHGGCRDYFRQIRSFSVVVHRQLEDGRTAVLELHQSIRPHDWSVVLSHRGDGWRAVDLVAGQSAR